MTVYDSFVIFCIINAIISGIASVCFMSKDGYPFAFMFIGLAIMFILAIVL